MKQMRTYNIVTDYIWYQIDPNWILIKSCPKNLDILKKLALPIELMTSLDLSVSNGQAFSADNLH